MSEKILTRLEKYLEITSEEKMERVNEVCLKYSAHKANRNALEACLLQVPIIEIWLSLILEHKLLIHQYQNLNNNEYFDLEYKNESSTTLGQLIKVYKIFFPELHKELDLFKKRRNNLSHFLYDKELPKMSDVELGDKLIGSLRELNQELYAKTKIIFNPKKD